MADAISFPSNPNFVIAPTLPPGTQMVIASGRNRDYVLMSPDFDNSSNKIDLSADEPVEWFVMRDLTRANARVPAWRLLEEKGFEVFTPMVTRIAVRSGRRIRETVPAIHDLLFVHSSQSLLTPTVERTTTLQYRYARGLGYRVPLAVRPAEMSRFIHASRQDGDIRYYTPEEITPSMYGHRVRIVGGPMDGYEGSLLKARGSRKRRLLVELDGLLTLSVEVSPEFITLLPE